MWYSSSPHPAFKRPAELLNFQGSSPAEGQDGTRLAGQVKLQGDNCEMSDADFERAARNNHV